MAVWLTFIGNRYYNEEEFITEAYRMGAQRAVPFTIMQAVKEGDEVYYAKWDEENRVARVFARGVVNGFSTSYDLSKIGYEEVMTVTEYRRCGWLIGKEVNTKGKRLEEIINEICVKEPLAVLSKHKWLVRTSIEEYRSTIFNTLDYIADKKSKEIKVIHKDIQFTRGFIILCNVQEHIVIERSNVIQLEKYKERTKGYFQYKPPMTNKDESLDRWLGE